MCRPSAKERSREVILNKDGNPDWSATLNKRKKGYASLHVPKFDPALEGYRLTIMWDATNKRLTDMGEPYYAASAFDYDAGIFDTHLGQYDGSIEGAVEWLDRHYKEMMAEYYDNLFDLD